MSKGVQDAGKFLRAVLVKEIRNAQKPPYTVKDAARLIAHLMMFSKDPEILRGLDAWGCKPPENWGDDKYNFLAKDEETGEVRVDPQTGHEIIDEEKYKTAYNYARKTIRRELQRKGTPFEVDYTDEANHRDMDVLKIKPDAGV